MRTATVIVLLAAAVAAAADRRLPSRRPVAATATATAAATQRVVRDFAKVLGAIPPEYNPKDVPPSMDAKLKKWLVEQVQPGDRLEVVCTWNGYGNIEWVGDVKHDTCAFALGEKQLASQSIHFLAVLKKPGRVADLEKLKPGTVVRVSATARRTSDTVVRTSNGRIRHWVKIEVDPATLVVNR